METKKYTKRKLTEQRVREIAREEIIKWEKKVFELMYNPKK